MCSETNLPNVELWEKIETSSSILRTIKKCMTKVSVFQRKEITDTFPKLNFLFKIKLVFYLDTYFHMDIHYKYDISSFSSKSELEIGLD